MPELPDIEAYLRALETRVLGARLERLELISPFLLRSVEPKPADLEGRSVTGLSRLGKRVVLGFEGERYAVLHLMIAGRLHWRAPGDKPGRRGLLRLHFDTGTLVLTEAGSKKRASLYLVRGAEALAEHDPGGIDVLTCGSEVFARELAEAHHTLKRALTDPRRFSGIGNAYSDEILHRAQLSPVQMAHKLDPDQAARLYNATLAVLNEWTERLAGDVGERFPEKVTAFRDGMAVHGRYRQPCPRCGSPVQRIAYANNETNYCPPCQTGGRLLADRALSRLMKRDWPRTLEELEALRRGDRG